MAEKNGNIVFRVMPGSPADKAGVMPGDIITAVNRRKIHDSIDLMFYADTPEVTVSIKRKDKVIRTRILREEGEALGIELKPFRIKRCKNRCQFCFVNQLPKGLRRNLYVKDEDFRMSFLYGNYVTLTNLTPADKKRIIEQRLSPLYVSVHSTNRAVRNRLLGNNNAVDIMRELGWFAKNRIRLHTQIVLCPGINDGDELRRTIQDLHKFYPYISSIAVVPVGLTRYSKRMIQKVDKSKALETIDIIAEFQKRFLKKYGDAFVHGADELYIKAGKRFPPLKNYGELPQIENGVGMVPYFVSRARKLPLMTNPSERRFLTVTGTSFYDFLKQFIDRLKAAANIELVPVENRFFGDSITVTGLLTGRDIIMEVSDIVSDYDVLLLPDVVLRDGGDLFLDGLRVKDLEELLDIKVMVIESTPEGLTRAMEER
jgi:putative radical SAM enzyme (TIGR03279 family)